MLHNTIRLSRTGLINLLLLVCFVFPGYGQVQTTLSDVHHDISQPLRDLVKTAPAQSELEQESEPIRSIPLPAGLKPEDVPDPVLQTSRVEAPTLLSPAPGLNFEGMGRGLTGFTITGAPPDTNGAVGLTQYVQWVNVSFTVFDKATGNIVLGPAAGRSLWQGFGGNCEINNDGDPIVLYDKLADRWIFSQFSVVNPNPPGGLGPFFQCVAVSTTSDATGSYNRYAFQYSSFDDYPKMGVWPDAYYVTFNMFNPSSAAFVGADACAYDRNAMLAGQAATQICFQQTNSVGGLLPSDVDGHNPPPPGSPNYMVYFGANVLNLFKFHVDFATPANSTFTGPTAIPVAPFTPLCTGLRTCVPQPNTSTQLDTLADRLMYRLAYRNFGDHESLVVNHSVAVGSPTATGGGVRWYEIQNPNGTPTVAQQSTFAPDTTSFRWMGSIAMDQVGDIALGYTVSSSSISPSVAFTARAAGDPVSTMQPETTIISGTGSQTTDIFGNPLTRWGDYSAMQVDPVDDCTFWYTSEYMAANGAFNWNTRIANFKFPGCDKPDLTISSAHTGNFTQGQSGATYTITAANAGSLVTSGTVTVVDTLPAGLTATAISGTGWSCDLPTLTCTRSDVLAAQSSYPAITLTVNVATNAAGQVTNAATVSGGGEINLANDSTADITTVIQLGPDPTITMNHTGTFIQGQTGTYNLTVTNVGLSALNALVTVTDTLPAGLTAKTVSGAGWSCVVGPPVKCTRSDALASTASYPVIALTVNVASGAAASVVNTATVAGGGETNTLNDTASDPTTISPPPPDLTISKTHTGNFQQGQSFASYTITVSNTGSSATSGTVSVTDTLPTGLTLTSMFGQGWSCNLTTCTRNDALATASSYPAITLNVRVAGDAPASVTNTAVVSGGGETNTSNDTANDVTTITPTPDLTITKTHVGNFTVGQNGVYTITVSNAGGAPTTGAVFMSDFLPSGMTATAITATGWNCSTLPTFFVNCSRSDALASGSSYPAITMTVRVDGAFTSPEINTASVSGGGELNQANDTASDSTIVNTPTLTITKTHSPATFIVGQTGTYTITVGNTGATSTTGSSANLVTVTDFLPQGMTATDLSASTGWTCSAVPTSFVNCTRSDALATGNNYPAIVMTVSINGAQSSSVVNNASVTGGGDLRQHSASDPTPVTAPALSITKTHTGNFTVGQTGNYTITVSNTGTVATVGTVQVNDFLPFGMTATAISATGWSCSTLPTQFVNCSRSDALAAAGSYPTITLTVSVDSTTSANVTNTVNVTGGGDLTTHFANDPTTINVPDLAITATHTGNFFAGESGAVYTLTVSNVGTIATAGGNVSVSDFLPQGLTATAITGAGWSCPFVPTQFVNCSRPAGTLAPGSSYPALTINMTVTSDAPASVINNASVGGIGDANLSNNSASDPTTIARTAVLPNSNANVSVSAGNPATFALNATLATSPSVGTVTFTATGLPPNSKAVFSPATVTQSGAVALTIDTSGNGHVAALSPLEFRSPGSPWNHGTPENHGSPYVALLFPLAGLIAATVALHKRKKPWLKWAFGASAFCLLLAFSGCGGGGSNPAPVPTPAPTPPTVTPSGTYTVTVTGTSSTAGVQPATTQVVLVVQ